MSDELPPDLVFAQPKRGRPAKEGGTAKEIRKQARDKEKKFEGTEGSIQTNESKYKGPATPRAEIKKGVMEGEKRAVDVAFHWADVEPAEEKQWVIDQMLRAMLGGLGYRDYRAQYQKEWDMEWDQGSEPEWENEDEYSEPDDSQSENGADEPDDTPEDEDNGDGDSGSDSEGESNENTDEVPF